MEIIKRPLLVSHNIRTKDVRMNLVNAAFMLGTFVFEIPTGAYADFFGRKRSYVIHAGLLSLAGLIYFFSHSFLFFILAELIAAISFTFASGAIDAWLVDNVSENWAMRTDYIFSQFFFLPFQADDISLLGYFFIFV